MRLATLATAATLSLTAVAAADPAPESPYAIGARVGGYGFHREGDSGPDAWTQCRMNGLGVFGQRALRGPLFVEVGLDTYFSTNQAVSTDLPIDRQSALVSVAAGVRTRFTSWLHGYAQLGIGAELAHLSVPYGGSTISDDKVMPDGFFGVGADIQIGRATFIGATLRTLVMGNFAYDPARLQMANQWVAAPAASDVFAASPDLVEQAQFYLRRAL